MTITKEYIEREGLTLKIQFSYDMGGMNYFQGCTMQRGYYLSVTPVEITRHEHGLQSESSSAFSGTTTCLLEVKRKSPKAEAEAMKLVDSKKEILIQNVLSKNSAKIEAARLKREQETS